MTGVMLLAGILLYSSAMMVIRLKMTEMAYTFEELKSYERSLREEQVRLRAEVSQRLSPAQLKLKGFSEPMPKQVVVIP